MGNIRRTFTVEEKLRAVNKDPLDFLKGLLMKTRISSVV